jgi:hypothetical protein
LTEVVAAAVEQARVRVVVQAGWAGLGPFDGDILLVGDMPHDWLFPHMATVVHHAGAGATGAGLRTGVPAVAVPVLLDQPFWAARLHQLGVAPTPLPQRDLNVSWILLANYKLEQIVQTLHRRAANWRRRHPGVTPPASPTFLRFAVSSEGRKARGARRGKREAFEPAYEPEDIGRQSREEMLEMGLALPDGAGAAQARGARGLGQGAFNPAARLIHCMELWGLLPRPSGQEQLMACWRKAQRHAPPGRLRFGAPRPECTGLASRLRKPNVHDGLPFGIFAAMPGTAVRALGAGHDPVGLVDWA